jgi:histidinol-phosphate aminotransferase
MELSAYFREHVRELEPYVPPEALEILARRHGLDPEQVAKLDFNENPYGPSPLVREVLGNLEHIHLYPDPVAGELRREVSEYAGVDASRILIGAGADEIISLLVHLFVEPGDVVLDLTPTYSMYGGVTLQNAGRVTHVPRGEAFEVDVLATLAAMERERPKMVWVCSPNNPTGNLATEGEVVPLLETGVPVVVDEAYFEFSRHTFAPLLDRYPNLIIMRTFSKLAGLAGLRVGYVLANEEVIAHAQKIKLPFNVTLAGQVAALAALRDRERLRANLDAILSERERMVALLREQGELRAYPSDANFILCEARSGDARGLHAQLAAEGVFVRYFPKPRIDNCLRISIGRPRDTDRLLAAVSKLRPAAQEVRA